MDYLYVESIKEFTESGFTFLDLGTVNERDGTINEGLKHYKKQLGAMSSAMKRYELSIEAINS